MEKKKKEINYIELDFKELSKDDQDLVNQSIEAAKKAYAPYSEFYVGAAVRLTDGTVLEANNQENAAYPSGICAERVAMFYANSKYPDKAVDTMAIVVVNDQHEVIDENISPCGACRQVIVESEVRFDHPVRILLVSKKSVLIFNSIKDLLPFSFNQGDLKRN